MCIFILFLPFHIHFVQFKCIFIKKQKALPHCNGQGFDNGYGFPIKKFAVLIDVYYIV